MAALTDYQKDCLSGVLSCWETPDKAVSRMQVLNNQLGDNNFQGEYFKVWRILDRYYPILKCIPGPEEWTSLIANATRELNVLTRDELIQQFTDLASIQVADSKFIVSVTNLGVYCRDNQWQDVLYKGLEILNGQVRSGSNVLSGFEDSVSYVFSHRDGFDNDLQVPAYEGDINDEVVDFLQRYKDVKEGSGYGLYTGLRELDEITGGLFPGDLMLIAGYTSEGKSKIALNIAYRACYEHCKNVVFGTNETTRNQVQMGMVVRHSHNPMFGDNALKYSKVKWGNLDADEESVLTQVLADMRKGANEDGSRRHGRMDVFQMPSRSSLDYVREVVRRRQRSYDVGLVVVDYLGLMASSRRDNRREELDDILVQAKKMAVDLQVPIVSPWQITRSSWELAQKSKSYTKASLSDTSQSERTSDIILSILKLDDPNTLKCQVLKNRDGEVGVEFDIAVDFSTSYVSGNSQIGDIIGA